MSPASAALRVALLLAVARTAGAEPAATAALTVHRGEGAESCLDGRTLERRVEQRLGRRAFVKSAAAPTLRLELVLERVGPEYVASIRVSSGDGTPRGERTLATNAPHCSALDDSLALALALLVDAPPEPQPLPEPPAESPVREPELAPAPPPHRLTIPADVAAPRTPWQFAGSATVAAAVGLLPSFAIGGAAAARIRPPRGPSVLFGFEAWLPREAHTEANAGARFRLLRAGLDVCPELFQSGAVSASWCIGQRLGWMSVEGFGFARSSQQQAFTFALAARARAAFRLTRGVAVVASAGPEVPLVRDRFVAATPEDHEVFRVAPALAVAELGAEFSAW